jgi:dipeptidyl aminopeptidase/acylaminoacyl peptidase
MSPDGRWIAVSIAPVSKSGEHRVASIWLIDVQDAGQPRQLTRGAANDHGPRWSPDGSQLAFLSDRDRRQVEQLQLLSLDGGEARPLTRERGGVSGYQWLPGDSARIAYLTPAARDEDEEQRRKECRDDAEVYGELWPSARLRILDISTLETAAVDTNGRHASALAVSPNGSMIALVLWETPEIDNAMGPVELAIVDVERGAVSQVIPLPSNPCSLTWTRDGDHLYYVAGSGPTAVASSQIWTVSVSGDQAARCLTPRAPFCVEALSRPANGTDILALVASGTESALYTFATRDERLTKRQHFRGNLTALTTSDDGRTVAAIGNTATHADEVYAGSPDDPLLRVSQFQHALQGIDFGAQEIVTWERDGLTLDGILIFPPGKDRASGPFPMVVSLHGGPYGRWANSFHHRFGRGIAQHGYLVFMPNPRGGSGHGPAFAEAVLNAVGNEDYQDIMSGVDWLVGQGLADPARLGCGGWSQGGFMSAWIVGHTDRFKAAVMGAGVSDWGMMIATSDIPTYENLMGGGNPYESAGPHSFDTQSPISYLHRVTTPVLILHGEKDARVPLSQGTFFYRGLRRYGVPSQLVVYPREPHAIGERAHQIDMHRRIAEWYRRWIPVD